MENLLSVRNLTVEYTSEGNVIHAVNGVSFDLGKGRTLGLVGETGAGKTSIAKAIMRILPDPPARIRDGQVVFDGKDILSISDHEMRSYRGRKISMIFQDPMTALNPVKTVSDQIADVIKLHNSVSYQEAKAQAVEMLKSVGIAANRANEYPHQFSGGMKQRVIIAIALACSPELLIADEPTTALDVTIQAQVMDLIARKKENLNMSMILITHDLGIVANVSDDVAVIYAGQIVEYGSKESVFDFPSHPYTKGLFGALPDLSKKVRRLYAIEGLPPDPCNLPVGCAFAPRCPHATDDCRRSPVELQEIANGHFIRCCRFKEALDHGRVN